MSQVILLSLTASLNPTLVAATTVMLPLNVWVGIPVRKPLWGSSERPCGNAAEFVIENVTGPSALAVMNRAVYWAAVVPAGRV